MDANKCEGCQESLKKPCHAIPFVSETSHLSEVIEALYSAIKHQHMKCYSMYLEKGASIEATFNETGHTALHIAVIVRNKTIVMDLINRGADLNVKDATGANVLHTAIKYKSKGTNICMTDGNINSECESDNTQQEIIEILTIFLDLGLDVDSKDSQHCTPLTIALEKRMEKVAEFLIDRGANVNHCNKNGNTVLHRLVTCANQEKCYLKWFHYIPLINLVLTKGANVESIDNYGHSALDLAVKYNLKDIAFILLQYINNVNLNLTEETKNKTTLHIYIEFIRKHIVAKKYELIKHKSRDKLEKMFSFIERMIKRGASVDITDEKGNSSLHMVMKYINDEKLILLLVQYTKNINGFNSDGNTLLHVFLKNYTKNRNISLNILIDLLCRGADVNKYNRAGLTAVHVAIVINDVGIFQILKENADFSILTGNGENAIHLACNNPEVNSEILDHLLRQGFDLTAPNNDALTPIHLAARSGNIQMIKYLLDQGIEVNCREKYQQRTPIHMAAEASNVATSVRTIEFLVQNGADINARDANDETTLLKVNFQKMNYIALFRLGADIFAEDKKGRNLLHRAMESNEHFIVKLLYDFGVNMNLRNCSIDERNETVKMWCECELAGTIYYEHIVKLELADLPVPEVFHYFMGADGPKKICGDNGIKRKLLITLRKIRSECERDCPGEIDKMKNFLLNDTMSIYDFLHMTLNSQIDHVDNKVLVDLILDSSINIAGIFPNYCGIIRAIYNEALKSKTRRLLKNLASSVLRKLSDCPIPDLCTEMIFNYLNNQDLNDVIMSLK